MRLSEETLERLAELVRQHLGLHFPPERWEDLERGLEATCRDLGEPGVEICSHQLLRSPLKRRHVEVLGRNLTIGETYFFREEPAFRALGTSFLPELVARRRREGRILRLWSAACATGEEPYSLAILLHDSVPDLNQWKVTLLATDINTEFLHKAENGLYGNWSFRTDRGNLREVWFTRTESGKYQVRPEIRRMVTFAYHNLAEDPYPSLANNTNAMDVIFCRNVLMYFSGTLRRKVLENLRHCLVEGGILFLGAAEGSVTPVPGLVQLSLPGLVAYQRRTSAGSAAAAVTVPAGTKIKPLPRASARPAPAEDTPAALTRAYHHGDYAEVCRRSAELKTGDPGFTTAALTIARACANQGKLNEALAWAEKVVSLRRLDADAHYLRAMILVEQGRTPESLDALRTTLFLDPEFIPAYVAVGNIHRAAGDDRQADRNFRNALILLERYADTDTVPHTEEMRAESLREVVRAALGGSSETR